MATSTANRGKFAEGEVKKVLAKLALRSDTAVHRFADARAGSFQPTLADFLMLHKGQMTLIEVKEVAHNFRLPHANLSDDQVARMRRFKLAGAAAYVLVYHTNLKQWRVVEVDFFLVKEGGSWNLQSIPLQNLDQILKEGTTYVEELAVPKQTNSFE